LLAGEDGGEEADIMYIVRDEARKKFQWGHTYISSV
jgi:hypothetical protein